jgi:hypothetical protein
MIAHCVSVNVMRIKVTSHLATLNHSAADLGILKRQQALERVAVHAIQDSRCVRFVIL